MRLRPSGGGSALFRGEKGRKISALREDVGHCGDTVLEGAGCRKHHRTLRYKVGVDISFGASFSENFGSMSPWLDV